MPITLNSLAEFLEAIPDAALVVDRAGSMLLANSMAEAIFGYPWGTLKNRSLRCLLPAAKLEIHDRHLAAYFADPKVRAMGSALELKGQRYDGTEIPVDIMLRALNIGATTYAMCVVRDMTLYKQNEAALKKAVEREQELARTDFMTGVPNARAFDDMLQQEINRLDRYKRPFTLAYFDLDNFKWVNDEMGHDAGDEVLRTVAQTALGGLRKTDSVARVAGDEFALLLPETGPELAKAIVSGMHQELLVAMQRNSWPVTFSIGVVTCIDTPPSAHALIKLADDRMYAVKNNGKNAVMYSIYRDADGPSNRDSA